MTDGRVGRLLGACLHQAISDEIPQRIDFYEPWLRPDGRRDGLLGLAPITAVLGFLRTEGAGYDRVVTRAGTLAADWAVMELSAVRRRAIALLPGPLRARAALRVASSVACSTWTRTGARSRVSRGRARLDVTGSVFCVVREPVGAPLCGFYLALTLEVLRQFGVSATGRLDRCQAVDRGSCQVIIDLARTAAQPKRAAAA